MLLRASKYEFKIINMQHLYLNIYEVVVFNFSN